MIPPSEGYLKALFGHLVKQYGGQDAAAVTLGVSRQRVGQLIAPDFPAMPRVMDIWALESALGRSVVFKGLSEAIGSQMPTQPMLVEACEVSEAAAHLLHLARSGASERELHAAAMAVQREAADVPMAARRSANAA